MSYIGSEPGMSLPEVHPTPEIKATDSIETKIDQLLNEFSKSNVFNPEPATDTTGALNNLNEMFGAIGQKAGREQLFGASMKTAAAAGRMFTNLLTYGTNMKNARMQAENTKLQAENQMAALDNQVLYYKNQITDKFNTLIARNTALMAAKNLRVSTGALLEQTKDAAYDATQDMRTMESNAELKKIALRSSQRQADITKKLQKTLLTANMVKSVADLGLMVASGGGTGRTLHPDNMAAGPASYGMTDTMGRMHSDAQFAGSSSVPAHVEMMGLIGMGNNPMVGATVALAVEVFQALNK